MTTSFAQGSPPALSVGRIATMAIGPADLRLEMSAVVLGATRR
ncbi:hypothetical protein [uncultured Friedmanniella sp.]